MLKHTQDSPAALGPGTILGGYRLEEILGVGGMGVVYRAIQVSLDREVALKVLSEQLASDPSARHRFVQEGILAARVVHPNVVRVLDVSEHDGRLLLAYELIVGGTLRQRLDKEKRLPVTEAVELCATCAEVLALLHHSGILHRDLKPANIFLSPGRGPLVGDLGIAKDLVTGRFVTQAGLLLGTPAYMAPEMVRGSPATASSDLYALGVVLYECLTGRPPFEAADPGETLRRHISEPAPDPCAMRPELPPAYAALTDRALAKEPADRFPDAKALAAALRQLPPPAPPRSGMRPAAPRTVELKLGRRPSRLPASATTRLQDPLAASPARPTRGRTGWLLGFAVLLAAAAVVQLLNGRGEPPVLPASGANATRPKAAVTPISPPAADRVGPTTRPIEPSPREARHWLAVPSRAGDETAWPGLDAACRKMRAGAAGLVELNGRLRRQGSEGRPEQILRETSLAFDPIADAAASALREMAPVVAGGRPGAARRAGEILASLYLLAEECQSEFRFTMGIWVSSGGEANIMLEGMRVPRFLDALARSIGSKARTLASTLPRPMLESAEPAMKGGLACLRTLELLASDGALRRKQQQLALDAGLSCFTRMTRPPRPPRPDALVARALLEAIWSIQQPADAMKTTLSTLESLRQPPGPGPAEPWEELLVLELFLESHRLAEPYQAGAATRQEGMARRLDDLVDARDRLITRWPYDPRTAPPARGTAAVIDAASLHLDMQRDLIDVLATTRALARQLGVPLGREAPIRRATNRTRSSTASGR